MDIRTISSQNLIPVIDPSYLKQSPDEFLAENGGFLSEVAVVGKSSNGFVHFRSATAPSDRNSKEFFSTFSTIADSIGIKVHGFVNALADSFLGKNRTYSVAKDGGNTNPDFVCPTNTSYTTYLSSIISEMLGFPIQGLVIDNLKFPHETFCFCERCTRTFSKRMDIERIFSLGDLQKDSRLENAWLDWRRDELARVIQAITTTAKSVRNIPVSVTMDIDPTLEANKGALNHFGQDISIIGELAIPTIHLSAWTSLPNSVSSPEFQLLRNSLQFVKDYCEQTSKEINLFLWGKVNEHFVSLVDALRKEVPFKQVFVQTNFPEDYQKKRETHLGLS